MEHAFIRKIYLIGFGILISSLFYYQIIKGNYYLARAKNNYVRVIPLSSIRGTIFDVNSIPIAYDKASFNIAVIPYQIKHKKNHLFKEISEFLNCDIKSISQTYNEHLQNIFSPVEILLNIDKITVLKLKEKFTDDILIYSQPKRYYPAAFELAHILGYVRKSDPVHESSNEYGYSSIPRSGSSGIEQYYDAYLKGENGGDLIEVNAGGKIAGFLGEQIPQKGKDIQLTIDSCIQQKAYQAIEKYKGAIIFMNSQTGEIISLVSSPSFDSNCFIERKNVTGILTDKEKPLLNRAIQSTYPIGSTFKPIAAAAALEEEKITPYTTYHCSGQLQVGNASFRCAHIHDAENLYDALTHSCNVYFYNLGIILGAQSLSKWGNLFGLNSLCGIDLPYEKKGFVPSPVWKSKELKQNWFIGDTVNFSIGQGFLEATPLENTLAFNVFANDGYLVKPSLIKKIAGVTSNISTKIHLNISSKTIEAVKKGLINAVTDEEGTAHYLAKLNLKIAGKTGTAQTREEAHGWFIGFFPYDSPKYTVCTFLENCGSSYTAVKVTYDFLEQLQIQKLL